MDSKVERFFNEMNGKRVAFCGIGGSNLPLIDIFKKKGAVVLACDRRTKEKLGFVAEQLQKKGVELRLGDAYLQNLDADIIFRTPGMKFDMPELQEARARGAAVTSEMEVFFDLCPCKIFAVTGSDGKTTTTTIISEMLKAEGKKVHLGGNIGHPLLPEIEQIAADDVAVVELSSFQLISMRQSPDVAVVTNLAPNHLDIHKDMAEYIDAKKNILLHQNAFGRAVLNLDNEITNGFQKCTRGQVLTFSRRVPVENGAWIGEDNTIFMSVNGTKIPVMHTDEIKIPGNHNIENYLAAITAVWGYVLPEHMRQVAHDFGGVEHRAEFVREVHGVRYYNDSIASSPTRTASGTLSLYKQKIILIAGGYDKKIPFDTLGPVIVDKVKILILMGNTAEKIEKSVRNASAYTDGNPVIIRVNSMPEAVEAAVRNAAAGDIVSMSPACASFDLYPNFEARGKHFKELINALV